MKRLALLIVVIVFAFYTTVMAANAAAGKATYDASCKTCHKDGLMGAPKLSDKAAWAPRIAQGNAVLVSKAIKGFKVNVGMMPPNGGNAKLTDPQIGDAVAYIVQMSK